MREVHGPIKAPRGHPPAATTQAAVGCLHFRTVRLDLDKYDAVLLDLDGTVYHEDHALPGAVELIRRLQARGQPYACLTNSTSSPARLTARLKHMGVDVDPAHIYTAALAACDYVLDAFGAPGAAHGSPHLPTPSPPPRVFNLSTEGVHEMLDGK